MDKKQFEDLMKKMNMLIAISLIKSGLTKEEAAESIGVTGRTIQNWFPVDKIKKKSGD